MTEGVFCHSEWLIVPRQSAVCNTGNVQTVKCAPFEASHFVGVQCHFHGSMYPGNTMKVDLADCHSLISAIYRSTDWPAEGDNWWIGRVTVMLKCVQEASVTAPISKMYGHCPVTYSECHRLYPQGHQIARSGRVFDEDARRLPWLRPRPLGIRILPVRHFPPKPYQSHTWPRQRQIIFDRMPVNHYGVRLQRWRTWPACHPCP